MCSSALILTCKHSFSCSKFIKGGAIYESCRNGSSLQPKAPSNKYTGFGLKGAPSSSLSSFLCFNSIKGFNFLLITFFILYIILYKYFISLLSFWAFNPFLSYFTSMRLSKTQMIDNIFFFVILWGLNC